MEKEGKKICDVSHLELVSIIVIFGGFLLSHFDVKGLQPDATAGWVSLAWKS